MNQTITKMNNMRLLGMAQVHHQRSTQQMHTNYSTDEYVNLLVDQEWENRHRRKTDRLLKAAKFKVNASISDIDLQVSRGLDTDLISRLSLLNFIKNHQNVLLTGPSGVGKSYIAQALGHQACLEGIKTLYYNTSRLLGSLKFAKMDNTYLKQLAKLEKHELIILDDFGLQQLDKMQREILMDIVEDRHQKCATIIASQIPINSWFDVIGEGTIADAILDRIVHGSYKVNLDGESLRKKNISK